MAGLRVDPRVVRIPSAPRRRVKAKVFKIQHGGMLKGIPWSLIAPHEAQALRNHDQSLERLNERGGLSPEEALAVLEGAPWARATRADETAAGRLIAMAMAHMSAKTL